MISGALLSWMAGRHPVHIARHHDAFVDVLHQEIGSFWLFVDLLNLILLILKHIRITSLSAHRSLPYKFAVTRCLDANPIDILPTIFHW